MTAKIGAYTESTHLIFKTFKNKNYSSRDTIPLKYLKKVGGEEMVADVARPEGEAAVGVPLLRLLPADLAVLNYLRVSANQRQADIQPIGGDSQIRDG